LPGTKLIEIKKQRGIGMMRTEPKKQAPPLGPKPAAGSVSIANY
jgi:hypothetical protein